MFHNIKFFLLMLFFLSSYSFAMAVQNFSDTDIYVEVVKGDSFWHVIGGQHTAYIKRGDKGLNLPDDHSDLTIYVYWARNCKSSCFLSPKPGICTAGTHSLVRVTGNCLPINFRCTKDTTPKLDCQGGKDTKKDNKDK